MNGSQLVTFGTIAAMSCGLAIGCAGRSEMRTRQIISVDTAADDEAGATIDEENRLFGALIGGASGARGGWLIGADPDWFADPDRQARAHDAVRGAEDFPATVEEVNRSFTADLNLDGFVTTDELIAMDRAGLSDDVILTRMRATDQIFDLSGSQRQAMSQAGVSQRVIRDLPEINYFEREFVLGNQN